jgi:rhodanese-related sulfurtransferase
VSTIGKEKQSNYALQPMSEDEFVNILLEGQPFIPKYFGFDVEVNKKGAVKFRESIKAVPRIDRNAKLDKGVLVVDARPEGEFKQGHLPGALNIQDDSKFETWLGSILGPNEPFYLIAQDEETLETVIEKAAKIGYEVNIKGALLAPDNMKETTDLIDLGDFKHHPEKYTIVDLRNPSEIETKGEFFLGALRIPLPELRERATEVPKDKPVVVHCAGGYRSAAGASILEGALDSEVAVYDLSEAVKEFSEEPSPAA